MKNATNRGRNVILGRRNERPKTQKHENSWGQESVFTVSNVQNCGGVQPEMRQGREAGAKPHRPVYGAHVYTVDNRKSPKM